MTFLPLLPSPLYCCRLSYTTFSYSALTVTDSVETCQPITVSVDVTNTGNVAGHEVVQVYASFVNSPMPTPDIQLVAFQRVFLVPGAKTTVVLTVSPSQTSVLNASDFVHSHGHHPGPSPPGPPPAPPSPCTNPCCKAVPGVLIQVRASFCL